MYFNASVFVNLQLHVCVMELILCHLQKKFFQNGKTSTKLHGIPLMFSWEAISGIPLNHIGRCIQILANLSNYALIKLHFNNW